MRTRALPGNGLITTERIRVRRPRRLARVAAIVAGATVGAIAGTALVATSAASPILAVSVCHDSNGARPGGSVYATYGHRLGCDVVHGQRLHDTRTPNRAACDHEGGHGWTAASRICWDIDY